MYDMFYIFEQTVFFTVGHHDIEQTSLLHNC
jgi:hypothetical protein